jgi:hypothetical protein
LFHSSLTYTLFFIHPFEDPSGLDGDCPFLANLLATETTDASAIVKNKIFSFSLQGLGWADLQTLVAGLAFLSLNHRL